MQALVAIIITAGRWLLFSYAGKIVVSILLSFGIGITTHKFLVAPFMDTISSWMLQGPAGEFGARAVDWMGVMRLDQAVSIVCGAFLTAQTIKAGKTALSKVTT